VNDGKIIYPISTATIVVKSKKEEELNVLKG
jgi:hypothetical protein